MAEATSAQERTELATPRRRERARAEGNVARSVEVASVAVLAAGLIGLEVFGARIGDQEGRLLRDYFRALPEMEITPATVVPFARRLAGSTGALLAPFFTLVSLLAVGAHVAQTGVLVTAKPLAPKLRRISPATGLKRIFSKRGMAELAKALLKLAIVGGIIAAALFEVSRTFLPLATVGVHAGYTAIFRAMFRVAGAAALGLGLLAALDFFFQRWDYEQQLRMTRQEVREEHKQNEGDPLVKSRQRARQQEVSRRRMMLEVRSADVVVTNPIRYAVALRYDSQRMRAPRVVAKGARRLARRIRELAAEAGVPVVENPPLARALYQACRVGTEVPVALYKAVAELLAFVFRDRKGLSSGGLR